MKNIILIGGGGHCKSIIDSLHSQNEFNIIGILDTKEKIGSYINEVKIIGDDSLLDYCFENKANHAFICIGNLSNPYIRINLYNKLKKIGFIIPNIIDKTSIISSNVILGNGNFIAKGCIINTNTIIGNNCIINTGSIIEHDCKISDFSHIAPGSTLSGGVSIGLNSHIGTNSTIIQNIKIGNNSIIGAGSVVVKDIGNNIKAYGNPCIEISHTNF